MQKPAVGCEHNLERTIIFLGPNYYGIKGPCLDEKEHLSPGDWVDLICPYGCPRITIQVRP